MALYLSQAKIQPADGLMQQEIMQCADQLSAEEVQLYYQIVLQGRQDLELSPDQSIGFEMLMLRMLAFSPALDSDSPTAEKKSL